MARGGQIPAFAGMTNINTQPRFILMKINSRKVTDYSAPNA